LSGGQIQRIGIARALFSSPQILVLDESTSSLDGSTENAIMNFIHKLRGEVTLIIIAHRLSTIKSADKVYYIAEGKIEAAGSFDAVIELVPDFAEQVKNSKA
jgi:ATP-binding cassette subfamily C protein